MADLQKLAEMKEAGRQAQADGRKAIPALDEVYLTAIKGTKITQYVIDLAGAWLDGWHAANVAEMVAE